jgi:hypothetical protein
MIIVVWRFTEVVFLFTGKFDGKIQIWNFITGDLIYKLNAHKTRGFNNGGLMISSSFTDLIHCSLKSKFGAPQHGYALKGSN